MGQNIKLKQDAQWNHAMYLFISNRLIYTSSKGFLVFQENKAMPHILEIAYCSAGRYEMNIRDYLYIWGKVILQLVSLVLIENLLHFLLDCTMV